MPRLRELQRKTEDLFLRADSAESLTERAAVRFSPFVPAHVEGALELVERWIGLVEAGRGNEGLEAALADAEREIAGPDPDRAKHALMIFITHYPKAAGLPIPALEERRPDLAAKAAETDVEALEAVGGEEQLDWFREDPLANQHHEHWHVVYPVRGIPDGEGGRTGKDRQGELFFYMHQQMLARYDAERLAVGLEPVRSLANYTGTIAEGYDSGLRDFQPRSPKRRLATVDLGSGPYTVQQHARLRDRIKRVVDNGRFEDGSSVEPDALGAAVEPSLRRGGPDGFGNFHGFGHVLIALAENPADTQRPGVMWTTATAIMDPVFYRWHRHVDDQLFRWQEKQPPHELSDAPPAVGDAAAARLQRQGPRGKPDGRGAADVGAHDVRRLEVGRDVRGFAARDQRAGDRLSHAQHACGPPPVPRPQGFPLRAAAARTRAPNRPT